MIVALAGVAWRVKRNAAIHGDSRTAASSAQSNRQAVPVPTQPLQTPSSTVATVAKNPVTTTSGAPTLRPGNTVEIPGIRPQLATVETQVSLAQVRQPQPMQNVKIQIHLNTHETVPAQIISEPQPAFPPWAKALELDGVVKLDALIDEKGNLEEVNLCQAHEPCSTLRKPQWGYGYLSPRCQAARRQLRTWS